MKGIFATLGRGKSRVRELAASADPVIGMGRREGMSLDAVFDDVSTALEEWSAMPAPREQTNRRQRRASAAAARKERR